jgi:hypothetical protein
MRAVEPIPDTMQAAVLHAYDGVARLAAHRDAPRAASPARASAGQDDRRAD